MDLTQAVWRKSTRSGGNGGNCVEVTAWRKSTRSGGNGGDCVEVAGWRKSSRSGGNGGDCVEAASLRGGIAVRDSKDPDGPKLVLSPGDWQSFTADVKAGQHDLA